MKKFFTFVVALLAMTMSANAEGVTVGATDNSAGWWTTFSDYYSLTGDGTIKASFVNYTDQVKNWDNWLLVCTTNAERDATGYEEYFVLRSDAYGWGPAYEADHLTSNLAEQTDSWATFPKDMNGASCVVTLTRSGNTVTVNADMTPADNSKTLTETFTTTISDLPETINCFFVVEKAHLENFVVETSTATGISSVKASTESVNAPLYNLAGQRVSKDAKGLLIKNGKKVIVK